VRLADYFLAILFIPSLSFHPQNSKDSDSALGRTASNLSDPITPRHKSIDITERKLNIALEELKEARERLKSSHMHHDTLVQDIKATKEKYYEQCDENKYFESKLLEKDHHLDRLRKEMDQMQQENARLMKNEMNLKQEMMHLRENGKTLSSQANKDKIKIQDLQRQCKEMETVLMKRHPDSVSALIGRYSLFDKSVSDITRKLLILTY
jgi:chromosome segregation ATPase